MHAQLITYTLTAITTAEYKTKMVDPDSSYFAGLETLVSKAWLADAESNRYGGFYIWTSKQAMEEFLASSFVSEVLARPFVTDVALADWPINETPSRTNRSVR